MRQPHQISPAFLEATLAVIFWGGSFIATKIVLREVSPVTTVWLRFTIGVLVLGAATWHSGQFAWPSRKTAGYYALLGFLGITFHQWLQSTGLVTAQATTTAWIITSTPVFIAVLGWLFLRERLLPMQVLGIGLAALGVVLIITQGQPARLVGGRFGASGDLLVLLSAPNWALFSILSRWGLRQFPARRMMFFVMGFAWLFTSLLLVLGPGLREIPQLTLAGWGGVFFLGAFCSGLAYIFWYDALKALPASQVGVFLYMEPFVTVVIAALLLNESFGWSSALGAAAILSGVWLVNRHQP